MALTEQQRLETVAILEKVRKVFPKARVLSVLPAEYPLPGDTVEVRVGIWATREPVFSHKSTRPAVARRTWKAGEPGWKSVRPPSHSLERKDILGGNAYQREIE